MLALPPRAQLFRSLAELCRPATTQELAARTGRHPDTVRVPMQRLADGNCPYRDAVRQDPAVVCTLHRGLAMGLLDRLAPSASLAGFVAKDPYAAGCLAELAGLARN